MRSAPDASGGRVPASLFLVWGGGGHGRVVADLVRALGYEVLGFVDRDAAKLGRVVEPGGARVIASEDDLDRPDAWAGAALALAVGDNSARLRCLRRCGARPAPALVHPSAACSPSTTLGAATVVFAHAVVNAAAALGAGVIVNSGAIVEHDCALDDGVHVSPGAVLSGGVRVGARAWVGAGAVVIQGRSIGADAIVGAGAVVIRDVPDGVTVVGNPARVLRTAEG